MANELPKYEFDKRMKCWELGMGDLRSAMECNIDPITYRRWRESEKLPINLQKKHVREKLNIEKRVALTNDDIANYNHNAKDVFPTYRAKEATRIVDIELAEKYAQDANAKPVTYKLEERVKARLNSKFISVDAKRNFSGAFTRVGS